MNLFFTKINFFNNTKNKTYQYLLINQLLTIDFGHKI